MRVHFNSWRDTDHHAAGGSELVTDQFATGLHERGHAVRVRAGQAGAEHPYELRNGGGTYGQYLLSPVHHAQYGRDADVIVDVINGVGFYSPLFSRKPVVGVIHHIHDEQWPMFYGPLVAKGGSFQEHKILPWAYRNSLIVTLSEAIHDELAAIGFHRDHLRHVPVHPELCANAARGTRSTTPMFVAAGRLAAGKRIDLLLKMWEEVRPHVGGRLVIVGDGPDRAALEASAGPGVEFVGFVSEEEKGRLFAESWALVHSAAREGWGLVISEAGLAATPSLGFDVPGVRQSIRDGRSGILAADESAFVEAWVRLGTDAELRRRLGAGARKVAHDLLAVDRIGVLEEILVDAVDLADQRRSWSMFTGQVARCTPQASPLLSTPGTVQQDAGSVGMIDLRSSAGSNTSLDATNVGPTAQAPTLSIVIPAFNEALRLPTLLSELPEHVDLDLAEVLVVNDGSTDNTAEVAATHLTGFSRGRVVELATNQGKGAALRAGVAAARGARIVFMDADMATDLRDLQPLLDALNEHSVAIGSRVALGSNVEGGSRHRRVMGRSFNWMIRNVTPLGLADTQCGFKAFRGPEAKLLFHLSEEDGFAQDVEILTLATMLDLAIAEVPVRWTEVPGSKVDPVVDSLRTAADLVSRRLRGNQRAVVTGITLEAPEGDLDIAAKEVARLVRSTDVTIAGDNAVHVLLPDAHWASIPEVGGRLAGAVQANYVGRWSMGAAGLIDANRRTPLFENDRQPTVA